MLTIRVGEIDAYNEQTQAFESVGGVEVQLEHSLVSLSKWEQIHEKPFLDKKDKTPEEILSYIECMLLTENPPGDFRRKLSDKNVEELNAYMNQKMSATWFSDVEPQSGNREVVTSELIYYWMTVFQIPFECETWHLNRLFTLLRICNIKQQKPKKMSRAQMAQRQRELNAQRKAALGSNG